MKNVALSLASTLLCLQAVAQTGGGFAPQCSPLPYATIAKKRPIDDLCSAEGIPKTSAHALEYRAKNNLCSSEAPINITMADMTRLQSVAESKGLSTGDRAHPLPDRSVLRGIYTRVGQPSLGEGDLVRIVAYVVGAKNTGAPRRDGTAGEGVNCNTAGAEQNDIHIELTASPHDKACAGIVAEMIPHFRPTSWAPSALTATVGRPMRFTGQLFFDGRHKVSTCDVPSGGDPPRLSLWEIHPVYAVDVCQFTDLSRCNAATPTAWVPLHQWIAHGPGKQRMAAAARALPPHREQQDEE